MQPNAAMLKRFSSTFQKDRTKDKGEKNGAQKNGSSATQDSPKNGVERTTSFGLPRRQKTVDKSQSEPAPPDHNVKSEEVGNVFEQFAQVIHAAQRPLPTQTGDGTYIEHQVPTGLFQDLRSMGFKDVTTLMDVMKNKGSGGLVDDKTYLMERVIQVCSRAHTATVCSLTGFAARQRSPNSFQEPGRLDYRFPRRAVELSAASPSIVSHPDKVIGVTQRR